MCPVLYGLSGTVPLTCRVWASAGAGVTREPKAVPAAPTATPSRFMNSRRLTSSAMGVLLYCGCGVVGRSYRSAPGKSRAVKLHAADTELEDRSPDADAPRPGLLGINVQEAVPLPGATIARPCPGLRDPRSPNRWSGGERPVSIYALKPRFQGLLRPLTGSLFRMGVTANQVTVVACAASVALGAARTARPEASGCF